jgi:hypothetical protein
LCGAGLIAVMLAAAPWSVAASADSDTDNTPDSTEQGQVDLSQSFDHRPVQALLHESSLVGLRDTTFSVNLRSFDLERENFDGSDSDAWALGGSAGVKTGYFGNFVALGATVYTSQRLWGPQDKDGTKLLQPGQEGYTVLGEAYGQFRLTDEISAIAGRKAFNTPFINTQDSLMTPNTFEVYALQGVLGGSNNDNGSTLRFGGGYVDQIKERDSENFMSMAQAAGAPAGVNRGVYVAGANYGIGKLSIGLIDYYSSDILNIVYSETKYSFPLTDLLGVRLAAQYAQQRSLGNDLLTGKSFSTNQYGMKAELVVGAALFSVARTVTADGTSNSPGSGTSMQNPWGSYPGYTAVQVENFYRAGESALLLRAAYNFPKITGLSVYQLWVRGSTVDVAKQYAQQEYDSNVQWTAQSGRVKGLSLRARYAHISQEGPKDQHENELRLILNYPLR